MATPRVAQVQLLVRKKAEEEAQREVEAAEAQQRHLLHNITSFRALSGLPSQPELGTQSQVGTRVQGHWYTARGLVHTTAEQSWAGLPGRPALARAPRFRTSTA